MSRRELRDAARDIARAKQALAKARDRLALASPVGSPGIIVDGRWQELHATLQRHRARLLAIPGVVGFGVGYRRRDGKPTDQPCIIVSVRAKRTPAGLKRLGRSSVPRSLRSERGRRVPVDVVQLGQLKRHLRGGVSIGRMDPATRGTIGVFATDLETTRPVALTAMHVSNLQEFPPGDVVAFAAPSPFDAGSEPLGTLRRGTRDGIDAMKVSVVLAGLAERSIEAIGPVRGWRPLTAEGDRGTPVRMFGTRSGLQTGRIEEPVFSLPTFRLDPVILVRISSQPGDSGAAIVDNQNLVLGLLAGELTGFPGLRAFCPIGLVLAVLRCDIPSTP